MNRPSSIVTAVAAVSAAFVLGGAPAATAASSHARAPHAPHGHSSSAHGQGHGQGQVSQDARRLRTAKAQTDRAIARTDAALARIATGDDISLVDPTDAAAVLGNIVADRAQLATLRDAVAAATTLADVRTLAGQVATVFPATYNVVLSTLLKAADASSAAADNEAGVADLGAQADALEAQGADVTAVRGALAAVTAADVDAAAAATAAHDLALALTATSPLQARAAIGQQVEAFTAALMTAAEQLQVARDALTALQAPPA